jgi:death-on-curing family protein
MIIFPNIAEIEYVANDLARKFMTWGEPIPDFSTRSPNIVESCLATPQQTYDGKHLYEGLHKKGAILFYLMIKNHPFQNGNKRIAVMTLLYFLSKNKKWLRVNNEGIYLLAVLVAESKPEDKDLVIRQIYSLIKESTEPYELTDPYLVD